MTAKKMAIFVEGQTERIFVKKLIEEIAGLMHVRFEERTRSGGKITTFKQIGAECEEPYFVLIYDCQGDEQVKTQLLDHRPSLVAAGYKVAIGLRDLHPSTLADLAKVKRYLNYEVPAAGMPTHIVLAVAEVEAWFLQDRSHYPRVHADLDPSTFKARFGFDPALDSAEGVERPAELLSIIYKSVGLGYAKRRTQVERTVSALDFNWLVLESEPLIPHFSVLANHIEDFMTA